MIPVVVSVTCADAKILLPLGFSEGACNVKSVNVVALWTIYDEGIKNFLAISFHENNGFFPPQIMWFDCAIYLKQTAKLDLLLIITTHVIVQSY